MTFLFIDWFIISVRLSSYSWFAPDVTAAMLVYRTIAKKVFWEFDYYYAKLERHFAIVLYTNMAASSRECNPRIDARG